MQKARIQWHSGLYYRNTIIVWTTTLLVGWLILTARPHWASMLAGLVGIYLVYFLWITYRSVHPGRPIFRRRTPSLGADLKPEKVAFLSRDGLELCAWFIPGRRRPVIILLHGLGGTGSSMSHQARILGEAGYNVLMLDLRAHGDSQGDTINGLVEVNDVLGALDYLATRREVDAGQVGILGVSFGALVALRAGRDIQAIRAVVLESLSPAALADHGGRPTTILRWVNYPFNWLMYRLFDWMSGVDTRGGVIEGLRPVYPRPVLFISTGRGLERIFVRRFYDAARNPKSILEVPAASQGIAFAVEPGEYRAQVLRVFDQGFRQGGCAGE